MFWKRRKREKALDISIENYKDVLSNNGLVFIFFKAPWCGACKILSPLVHELAAENREKDIIIAQVHTDRQPELSQMYGIKSLPTLIVFQDEEIIYKGSGMISKPRLQEMIDSALHV